jgi:hypothetical protein
MTIRHSDAFRTVARFRRSRRDRTTVRTRAVSASSGARFHFRRVARNVAAASPVAELYANMFGVLSRKRSAVEERREGYNPGEHIK